MARSRIEVKEIVEDLGYELIDEYMGKNYMGNTYMRRIVIKDKIGYKYDVTLNSLQNHQPSFVSKSNPFVLENIPLWLEINNKPFRLKEGNIYLGNHKKLFFSCDVCLEDFDSAWDCIYSQGHGCHYCSGHRVSDKNRLSLLYPEIALEWHPTKNGNLTPYNVSFGSREKIWWVCEYEHEWEAKISNRTNGKGCPYCAGKIVTDRNRLSLLYPNLISEWHPTKNGDLTPDDVSFGVSKEKAWWLCEDGHEWETSIKNRTKKGSGCPKCASSKGERDVESFLKEFNVAHIPEYRFEDCRYKNTLPFDFAVFDSDGYLYCIIEYHGEQHYFPVEFFGGEKAFRELQIRDNIKNKFCEDNNIPLKIIPYWEFDNIENILQDYLF